MTQEEFDRLLGRVIRNDDTLTELQLYFEEVFQAEPGNNVATNLDALVNALEHNTNLKKLIINFTHFGPVYYQDNGNAIPYQNEVAVTLGKLITGNKGITTLFLHQNSLTTECAKYISDGLKSNTTLRYLDVGDNPGIGEQGVQYFINALKENCTLRKISLNNTGMTRNSMESLLVILGHENKSLFEVTCCNNRPFEREVGEENIKRELDKIVDKWVKNKKFAKVRLLSSTLGQALRDDEIRDNNRLFRKLPPEILVHIVASTIDSKDEKEFDDFAQESNKYLDSRNSF